MLILSVLFVYLYVGNMIFKNMDKKLWDLLFN